MISRSLPPLAQEMVDGEWNSLLLSMTIGMILCSDKTCLPYPSVGEGYVRFHR